MTKSQVHRFMVFLEGDQPPRLPEVQAALEKAFPTERLTFLARVNQDGEIIEAYEYTVFRLGRRTP